MHCNFAASNLFLGASAWCRYSKERMRLMADDPPEPLDQDSYGFGVLDGEMSSEDALQVMHALEGNTSYAGLGGPLEGVDEDSEDTEEED